MNTHESPTPRRLLSIREVCRATGIGRSLVFSEIKAGNLVSLKLGRRRLVSVESLTQYISEREADSKRRKVAQ